MEGYNLSDGYVQLGGYAFAIIQFVGMMLSVNGIVMYNLFKGFCMMLGLCLQFTYVELVYFLCRFGMSCVVQFIYVELIYFLGFLE